MYDRATLAVVGGAIVLATAFAVNRAVPEPYMDEIFHIPQMQRYAAHDPWRDPKITTPDLLYHYTIALGKVLQPLLGPHITSVAFTRATNTFGLLLLPLVLYAAAPTASFAKIAALVTLPPLWFFGFLYYTDIWSVLCVFAMLGCTRHYRHILASLCGAIALCFRQNNVVWVLFACGAAVLDVLERYAVRHKEPRSRAILFLANPDCLMRAVAVFLPYTIPLAGFGAFVKINGGVALGDRANHTFTLHLAQLGYFFAFAAVFGWPSLCSLALRMRITRIHMLAFVVLTACGMFCVYYGTVVHPFVLADNRHYFFYVWRRIIDVHPYSRFALVPIYAASATVFILALSRVRSPMWAFGFVLATALALVPAPLVEPRYMLVPYMLMRMQLPGSPLEVVSNTLINAATMYLFLYRPFSWPDGSLQRFMW